MNRSIVALMFVLAAGSAAAQSTAAPALDATQLAGRNLFTQHCVVCHVKTLMTAARTYGPALSKSSLGGQEAVMREVISNGTPNMPGFKYTSSRPDRRHRRLSQDPAGRSRHPLPQSRAALSRRYHYGGTHEQLHQPCCHAAGLRSS